MSRSQRVQEEVIEEEIEGEDYLMTMDEIAAAAMQGLLASGQYVEPGAATEAAWLVCVPAFVQGRQRFLTQIAPMLLQGLPG